MQSFCTRFLRASMAFSVFMLFPGRHAVLGDSVSGDGYYFSFASRPDIQAPVWDITFNNDTLIEDGYWFVAPYEIVTQTEPVHAWVGPYIYSSDGQLIWSGAPTFGRWNVFDFGVASVQGQPHLTLLDWHMQRGVILDSSYNIRRSSPLNAPGDDGQNMHAYHVIDNGARALTLSNRQWKTSPQVSESVGYHGECRAGFQGLREWDLLSRNPNLLFEWDGKDHVNLNESKYTDSIYTYCKDGWDLMHTNAVDKFPDGDYLLSARHTDTLYKISHVSGEIIWRLGGLRSDFKFLEGIRFSRQHHSRVLEQNVTHSIISLFDNAKGADSQVSTHDSSRGLILSLNMEHMTAEPVAQYQHPRGDLIDGRGSFQILPNGNVFVGWAESSRISEHSAGGELLVEAALVARHDTYRAFKFSWTGSPSQPPDVYAEVTWPGSRTVTTIHMSWNGATEVATWNVKGNDGNGKPIHLLTTPRTGFETTITYDGFATNVYAEALDRHGNLLGTSERTIITSKGQSNGHAERNLGTVMLIAGVCIIGIASLITFVYVYRRRKLRSTQSANLAKGNYQLLRTDVSQDDPN